MEGPRSQGASSQSRLSKWTLTLHLGESSARASSWMMLVGWGGMWSCPSPRCCPPLSPGRCPGRQSLTTDVQQEWGRVLSTE